MTTCPDCHHEISLHDTNSGICMCGRICKGARRDRTIKIGTKEYSLQVIPTETRAIADTGDSEECCVVCGGATDTGHTADECFQLALNSETQVSDYLSAELLKDQEWTKEIVALLRGITEAAQSLTKEIDGCKIRDEDGVWYLPRYDDIECNVDAVYAILKQAEALLVRAGARRQWLFTTVTAEDLKCSG